MEGTKWITKSGNLTLIHELEYFDYQLDAVGAEEFSLISGNLPSGIQLTKTGKLQGIPVITNANETDTYYTYEFTIRAKFFTNAISDRTFSITVTSVTPPQIVPVIDMSFGPYLLGDRVDIQLQAIDSTPNDKLDWSIVGGKLPDGVSLNSSGKITGNVLQQQNIPLISYIFSVQVTDGVNVDRRIFSFVVDEGNSITRPILLTDQSEMVPVRHDNFYSFKFNGYDFEGDELEYFLLNELDFSGDYSSGFDSGMFDSVGFDFTTGNTIPQMVLDPETGWLHGYLPNVNDTTMDYQFFVGVRKRYPPNTESLVKKFVLRVVPYEEDEITWISDTFLGTLNNGEISDIQIRAESFIGEELQYSIVPYNPLYPTPTRLPQGLYLQDNGFMIGRTNFRYFSLNGGNTTIDSADTTFDETYRFAVMAQNLSKTQKSTKVFSIRVRNRNKIPFENVYIKALPPKHKRTYLDELINDQTWLPSDIVFRENDPYFGRVDRLSMLFLPGIEATALKKYSNAVELNHYRKTVLIDELKVATATDSNFNPLYEVIYFSVRDELQANGLSPPADISLITLVKYFYKIGDEEIKTLQLNSYQNMKKRLFDNLPLENRGVLPKWMTSIQPDGSVLGLIDAIPIAYVKPGTSQIAIQNLNRILKQKNVTDFTELNFEVDRYHIDNYLSTYYDSINGTFFSLPETTFDRYKRPDENTITFEGYANYALNVPFETVNNQNYYKILGGSVLEIISDQTYRVNNTSWSDWMNSHAVWKNNKIRSEPNSNFVVERDFYVSIAGFYNLYLMHTHETEIFVNGSRIIYSAGYNVTENEQNVSINFFLASGKNTIRIVMRTGSGSVIWGINPMAVSAVISSDNGKVFDTATTTDAKVEYSLLSLRPGLDGDSDISSGKLLIFAIQEDYEDFFEDNNGWNDYGDLYGDEYDTLPYNDYSVVPGLYEKSLDQTQQTPNKRAGLWKVVLDNDFVIKLKFVKEVSLGNYFIVLRGETYGGEILRLNTVPPLGKSELNYQVISEELTEQRTKFDNNGTRFIEFRELYSDPDRGDKYIIFPKVGVFE